jgi:glycosyltransferase involved in cell wall biosynthesis
LEPKFDDQLKYYKNSFTPKVSVGIPVYNGEKYIRQAIDSVLAQTYSDFELVISDNSSTDGTEEICRDYCKKDIRIKYVKQPVNIGAINNFNYLLKNARGIYFVWLSHDDYLDAAFLEVITLYLDEHTDVALCFSDSYDIKDGVILRTRIHDDVRDNIDWKTARRRFFTYNHRLVSALYGIYRSRVMHTNNIYLQPGYKGITYGVERSILPRVALQGKIVALPKPMRYTRIHNESLGVTEPRSLKSLYVLINVLHNIIKYQACEAHSSKLPLRQKLAIYGEMLCYDIPIIFQYLWACVSQPRRWF